MAEPDVYPVPDPRLAFLDVHVTRGIDGGVHAGPNAVLALALREAPAAVRFPGLRRLMRRYALIGAGEIWRDKVRAAFVRQARRYLTELTAADLVPGAGAARGARRLAPRRRPDPRGGGPDPGPRHAVAGRHRFGLA